MYRLALCVLALAVAANANVKVNNGAFDPALSSTGGGGPVLSHENTVVTKKNSHHNWDTVYSAHQVHGHTGLHEMEFEVLEYEDYYSNVFELSVGLTTVTKVTWYWQTSESYGYMSEDGRSVDSGRSCCSFNTNYGTSWGKGDKVTVVYDSDAGTVGFKVNGVDQGIVATGLSDGPFRFAVSVGDNKEKVKTDKIIDSATEEWTDYEDVVCKQPNGKNDNDDGTWLRYKSIEPNTMDQCKSLCLSAPDNDNADCFGIEYFADTARCDIFTQEFTHWKKKKGRTCSQRMSTSTTSLSQYKKAGYVDGELAQQTYNMGLLMIGGAGCVVAAAVVVVFITRRRTARYESYNNVDLA